MRLAGVTTVLRHPAVGIAPTFEGIDPVVLETARQRGEMVDLGCDLIDTGELDWGTVDERIKGRLKHYQHFKKETGFQPLGIQQQLEDPVRRVRGRLDVRGPVHRRLYVLDRKATWTVHRAAAIQSAAYALMLLEAGFGEHDIGVLHLRNETYRLITAASDPDYEPARARRVWCAAVDIYWESEEPEGDPARAARMAGARAELAAWHTQGAR